MCKSQEGAQGRCLAVVVLNGVNFLPAFVVFNGVLPLSFCLCYLVFTRVFVKCLVARFPSAYAVFASRVFVKCLTARCASGECWMGGKRALPPDTYQLMSCV